MKASRTYGVLLRVYTPKSEEVAERVDRAIEDVRQIVRVSQEFPIRRLILLVPSEHDCGETYNALFSCVVADGLRGCVEVYTVPGHHSCEVLNSGLKELVGTTSHALIISGKAVSYLTSRTMSVVDQAFECGAKVAGLTVGELRAMVSSGRIQNTFAVWKIPELLISGGFDCKTGVEEIAPLIRLVKKFGCCIAPIEVEGTLDIFDRDRHKEVMRTKVAAQEAEYARLQSAGDRSIRKGVMW